MSLIPKIKKLYFNTSIAIQQFKLKMFKLLSQKILGFSQLFYWIIKTVKLNCLWNPNKIFRLMKIFKLYIQIFLLGKILLLMLDVLLIKVFNNKIVCLIFVLALSIYGISYFIWWSAKFYIVASYRSVNGYWHTEKNA